MPRLTCLAPIINSVLVFINWPYQLASNYQPTPTLFPLPPFLRFFYHSKETFHILTNRSRHSGYCLSHTTTPLYTNFQTLDYGDSSCQWTNRPAHSSSQCCMGDSTHLCTCRCHHRRNYRCHIFQSQKDRRSRSRTWG